MLGTVIIEVIDVDDIHGLIKISAKVVTHIGISEVIYTIRATDAINMETPPIAIQEDMRG